jgi:hypothetical protein
MNLNPVEALHSQASQQGFPTMSRNALYLLVGVLLVVVVGFGIYMIYQEQQRPRLEIRVDEQGLTIDGNS